MALANSDYMVMVLYLERFFARVQ